MKLNHKQTILVGLAFLSICAFWQVYDSVIPLILKKTFSMDESLAGAIMALDNILALFLLPFFGGLSDRTHTRLGRRTPFILAGTAGAVILMNLLPVLDNSYARNAAPYKLALFIAVLGLLLFTMGTYRSPAVALMPDVTPKPLRSRGNAIINLMGAMGSVFSLAAASLLYPASRTDGAAHTNYQPLFLAVSTLMALAAAVLFITVREPALAANNQALEKQHPEWNVSVRSETGQEMLPGAVKRSLGFLLASIALWYIGYNGVTTWFTTYIDEVMGEGLGGASNCLLVATAGAVVSYIPVGAAAARFGRKRSIQAGTALLASCFLLGYFLTTWRSSLHPVMYIVFALVGLAWAAINVNSLPMVVEMCRGSDLGKFTGYYYAASMAAQVVTPVLAGTLMRRVGYASLFPYAAVFVALSHVTMLFVRHGDAKAQTKTGLDAFEDMDG